MRSLSVVGALFGASSAREHQHEDEAGGDNRGLQIQRQREIGGGTEEREEGGHDPLLLPARSSSPARHNTNYLSELGSGNYDNERRPGAQRRAPQCAQR